MRQNKPAILITAEVDELLLKQIISKEINADVIPFIKTEINQTKKTQQQIENVITLNATVIFTSKNAIEAVSEYLQNKKPNWKIYCIGNTTRILVEKYFGKESIASIADDATALAKKTIADDLTKEVYLFCGDKRRDELPELLLQNNISVNEIEVYTTTILHHTIEKGYGGILFFSPSAVEGFFKNNKVNENTILFAIGTTTANEIKRFSKNKIIVSNKADKKNLIEKVIEYFQC
ncbi:MAG: uroporphyrinogen-III synthase [Parafilimonas sp.]